MLGISSATFFMLGMMVGNLTSSPKTADGSAAVTSQYAEDCRISGVVTLKNGSRETADTGAVVVLLPRRITPEKKEAPGLIMPKTFVALDNPTIGAIHDAGGAVVRADADGKFNLLVDQGREFRLLVVSKGQLSAGRQLSEQQSLMLEKWFAPAEKLIRDNDFLWREVSSSDDEIDLGYLTFE